MITLYTSATPNGWKVSISLEEMGLPYDVYHVNLMAMEQREEWFLALNPNGRIPAIIDHEADDFSVFESGAILVYLAEKTGKLLPREPKARSLVLQWLMFQMGGIGPMMGQSNVFFRYWPEKIQPVIDRYQGETRRLFRVLDKRLADNEFLAGEYSIADIANWSWVHTHNWSGVSLDGMPHLYRWVHEIGARPAVDEGIKVPVDVRRALRDADEDSAEEFARNARSMVETGHNDDEEA